ncbi:MAG TPA: Ig-like domain-containing protein, partial [Gemmatimonadaceae bacterium]|nr:Ig-like domain-containing protein [Gemmatimonadaceae bacterium]
MNVARSLCFVTTALVLASPLARSAHAQYAQGVVKIVAEPARLTLKAGETVPLKVTALDKDGKEVSDAMVRVGGPRDAVRYADGQLTALRAGSFTVVASAFLGRGIEAITLDIPVIVSWPALAKISVTAEPGRLYVGTMLAHSAKGAHADGSPRAGLAVTWRSSDPAIATVDRFGNVIGVKPGAVTISAEAEGVVARTSYTVAPSPVARIEASIAETSISTGDVVHLKATARRANGEPVADAKIDWSYLYTPDDTTAAPGGPGIIDKA